MTSPILFAAALQYIFGPLILLTSVFLILIVLVQRGRGGGLTGALGGAGGQSAFGAKAGDVFTKITVVVASFWIVLCILATMSLQDQGATKLPGAGAGPGSGGLSSETVPAPEGPAMTLPSDAPQATTPPAGGEPAANAGSPAEGAQSAPAPSSTPQPEGTTSAAGEEKPKQ